MIKHRYFIEIKKDVHAISFSANITYHAQVSVDIKNENDKRNGACLLVCVIKGCSKVKFFMAKTSIGLMILHIIYSFWLPY